MRSPLHPKDWARYRFYLAAAGVTDADGPDAQFVDALVELIGAQPHPSRHLVLAFDHRYDPQGRIDLEHSELERF